MGLLGVPLGGICIMSVVSLRRRLANWARLGGGDDDADQQHDAQDDKEILKSR